MRIGDPAPQFALRGVDGREHTLASYDGADLLVLIQSCNHCPYVIAWEQRMVDAQADYADRGVRLVAVNSNDSSRYPEDTFEKMTARAAERGFNFDYLQDPEQTLVNALGAGRTPEVFVFDHERRLVYHGAVDDNRDETAVTRRYLRDALDAALAGRGPEPAETQAVGCTVKWLPS